LIKEICEDQIREWNPRKVYDDPVIGQWRPSKSTTPGPIVYAPGGTTDLREFFEVVGLERRRGSWDFAQEFHTTCGRRRGR